MTGIELNFIRLLRNFKNLYSGGDVVTDTSGSKPDYIYMFGGEIGIIVYGNCKYGNFCVLYNGIRGVMGLKVTDVKI